VSALADWRVQIADALATIDPEWPAAPGPVDQVSPPMFVVSAAADPWLVPAAVCSARVQLQVLAVAGRVDPAEGGLEVLEQMVERALPALQSARVSVVSVGAAVPLDLAGVPYLVARITVANTLTVGKVTP
jgi:hypothetical protein